MTGGLQALDPDRLQAGEELAQEAIVCDPTLAHGRLLLCQIAADGLLPATLGVHCQ